MSHAQSARHVPWKGDFVGLGSRGLHGGWRASGCQLTGEDPAASSLNSGFGLVQGRHMTALAIGTGNRATPEKDFVETDDVRTLSETQSLPGSHICCFC